MRLCDYVQLLYPYVGRDLSSAEYLKELFDKLIAESNDDFMNPLYDLTPDYLNRIYNGSQALAKTKASAILNHRNTLGFSNYIDNQLNGDANACLQTEIDNLHLQLKTTELSEQCAEILVDILNDIARNTKRKSTHEQQPSENEKVSLSRVPIPSMYVKDGKIHIGNQIIKLPERLSPPQSDSLELLPYEAAILAAYAQALGKNEITKEILSTLPAKYKDIFNEQQQNYYNAEYVRSSVGEVFNEGAEDFQKLKEDTYTGIRPTCWKEYPHGLARLLDVLEQSTKITLTKSFLAQITNLIGNSEKGGVCHMLVNDGRIYWVNNDE